MKKILLLLFISLSFNSIFAQQLTVFPLVTDVNCNGANNGAIQIFASGDYPPFSYSIDNGVTFQQGIFFLDLSAGDYDLIVKDNNSNTISQPFVVSEPMPLICNSVLNTNTVTVSATGGTAPYQYAINGGPYQASPMFGQLSPGNYTIQVRDSHHCTCASNPITISDSGFSVNIGATLDMPTSTLIANVTGGTAPFTYQWGLNGVTINGAVNQTLYVYGQFGEFNVTVTDANGLTAAATTYVVGIPIYANDDAFTVYPINVGNSVSSASVLSNDILSGLPVNTSGNAVTLTPLMVPAGFLLNNNGKVSVLPGTSSGTYTLTYQICPVANSGYCDQATALITVVNQGIRLNAFVDSNNNGTQDVGEANFLHGQFGYELNNNGTVNYVTSSNGDYFINETNPVNSYHLTYAIDPVFAAQYNLGTSSYSNVSIVPNSGTATYNFPVTETPFNDLAVLVYQSGVPPRPGFDYVNRIKYKNNGNQIISSGTVTFTKNNAVSIINISQAGTTNTPTGFTYDFTNLLPGEFRNIDVTMQVPAIPTVALGQALTNTASITIPAGDIHVLNNSSSLTQIIVGSYDPNDKTESHGGKIVHSTFTANDYLTYTIQFENTGTANAENVRVNDILDSKLDETSVKMLDASHAYTLNRVGNNLDWNFNGIDLPAAGGKGYLHFQVKPKPGYAVGDIIPNTANIYFDFNPAIVTNTFNTEFVTTLSVAGFENTSFVAYPNPTNGQLTISLKNNTGIINTVEVNTLLGKTVQTNAIHNSTAVLDLSNLSEGIYFVKVKSEGEEKVMKIIKQ